MSPVGEIVPSNSPGAALAVELGGEHRPFFSVRDFYAFERHVKTARQRRGLEIVPQWYQIPVFYFSNHRSLIPHGAPLRRPKHGKWLDFELEVAAIIGHPGMNLRPDQALDHVLGLTVLNDWSLRDLQREEMKVGLGPAKGKDFATSIGPVVVPLASLSERRTGKGFDLEMTARVNGVELSRGNLNELYYSLGELIAQASRDTWLHPGDVIGTGTVGSGCLLELTDDEVQAKLGRPSKWLIDGDVVELEVEAIGILRNEVVAPSRDDELS